MLFMIVLPLHFAALTAKRANDRLALVSTVSGFVLLPVINMLNSELASLILPVFFGFGVAYVGKRFKRTSS